MTRPARRVGALALAAAALAAGCRGGADSAVEVRAPDGLLSDPVLQHVVELQTERDGASLVGLLASPESRVRARAAFALGSVQDPSAVPSLVAALRDTAASVRADAAFALGQVGDASAVTPLAEAFGGETRASVRVGILEALGRIPGPEAPAALLALPIGEAEALHRVRALARAGLSPRGSGTDLEGYLVAQLGHADPAVRGAAARYFARVPDPGPWARWAGPVRDALAGHGYDEVSAMYLVQALGRLGDPSDGALFRAWAANARDWRVRCHAVSALGGLPPDPGNREALFAALDDASGLVALAAARALGRAGALPPDLQRMKEWIGSHPDRWQVAAPLLDVLAAAGEAAFVLDWVDGLAPDEASRWAAAVPALAALSGPDGVERLGRAAASPHPEVQGPAVRALRERWARERVFATLAPAYFDIFSHVLRSGSPHAARVAAEALSDPAFAELGAAPDPARADAAAPSPRHEVDWADLASLGPEPRLRLETERGVVVIRLLPEEAPLTVHAVTRLARDGAYDGTPFHRVVPGFVTQGGDTAAGDGYGDAGFTLPSELTRLRFTEGVVGMASAGKDTESSQFFVTHAPQPHLDGAYTAFGWVEEGLDVVFGILPGDRIVKATVERGG